MASIDIASLVLLMVGIGLAFSDIRLSGWVLSWVLLSGALLVQWFRSVLNYSFEHGGVDPVSYQAADEWMGLGFSLLIVASMYMMREVLKRHSLDEQRIRVISEAAQDAIVVTDERGRVALWNEAGRRIFGFSRDEAMGKRLPDLILSERHRGDFESRFVDSRSLAQGTAGGKTLDLPAVRKDTTEIITEASISSVSIGGKRHAVCIFRDVTARRRADQALSLEYAVARCLDSTENVAEALQAVLRAICQTLEWDCGRCLRVDADGRELRLVELWATPSPSVQAYVAALRDFAYEPGNGIPGKVWQSGQPLWIADVSKDSRAVTKAIKSESTLRGAFAFPLKVEGNTIGVLAFGAHAIREPDPHLLAAIQAIGSQVGGFLHRRHELPAGR